MQLKLHDENEVTNNLSNEQPNNNSADAYKTFNPELEFDPTSEFDPVNNYDPLNSVDYKQSTSRTMYHEPPKHKLTKEEFFNKGPMMHIRSNLIASTAAIIILTIIDVIRSYIALRALEALTQSFGNELGATIEEVNMNELMVGTIIIALIIIGLAVGIYVLKSRVCACIALAITVFLMLGSFISVHRIKGLLLVLACGYAVRETFRFNSAWEEYDTTGKYPGID